VKTQTTIGKLWTGAVAYVSLLTGSGLSIAGNVADTFRTRGQDTDALDIIMAGAFPVLVILTIEMFVSRRWATSWGFQALRWFGCLAIGSMAMIVSWLHLHDLMATRGQLQLVAILGPLAIDGMAVMATGLILSTRAALTAPRGQYVKLDTGAAQVDVAEILGNEAEDYLAGLSERLGEVPSTPAVPVVPGREVVQRTSTPRGKVDEAEMAEMIKAAEESGALDVGQVNELLAAHYAVSTRTIRRIRARLKSV